MYMTGLQFSKRTNIDHSDRNMMKVQLDDNKMRADYNFIIKKISHCVTMSLAVHSSKMNWEWLLKWA